MRTVKIFGLILAGMLAISSTALAGGHGGGGHGGGGHFGGGHFGAGHYAGGRFGWHGGRYGLHGGHLYGGPSWGAWYDPYDWWDYPYGVGDSYGYYDAPGAYSDNQSSYDDATSANGTVAAAQAELAKLGYYHGSIDGVVGPETETAVRQFQSVDNLPVTGQLDDQTLQALQRG
jgi:hypothetical protein